MAGEARRVTLRSTPSWDGYKRPQIQVFEMGAELVEPGPLPLDEGWGEHPSAVERSRFVSTSLL